MTVDSETINQVETLGAEQQAATDNARLMLARLFGDEARVPDDVTQDQAAHYVTHVLELYGVVRDTSRQSMERCANDVAQRRQEIMGYIGGQSVKEIAEQEGKGAKAIKVALARTVSIIHERVQSPEDLAAGFNDFLETGEMPHIEPTVIPSLPNTAFNAVLDKAETELSKSAPADEYIVTESVAKEVATIETPDFESEVTPELLDDDEIEEILKTSMVSSDLVNDYLRKTRRVNLLTAEEEVDLAKRIEAGVFARAWLEERTNLSADDRRDLAIIAADGQQAQDHMLEANLRLVISIAKRYTRKGLEFADVIQEGNMGLIRAMQKFDYTKGYKFSTYATWWIRQAITRGIDDQGRTIRVPVHTMEKVRRIYRAEREILKERGQMPSVEEVAAYMNMDVDKVVELKASDRKLISLATPLGEDGDSEFGDLIEDTDALTMDEHAMNVDRAQAIESILDTLGPRHAEIIKLRFGFGGEIKTLDEIGKIYGVSRERIRQLENQALARLRTSERRAVLRPHYVD